MYLQTDVRKKNNDFFNDFEGIHEPHFWQQIFRSIMKQVHYALGIVIQW